MPKKSPLTISDKKRLEECEAIVERGMTTFVEVGHALAEISDKRLYRSEYGTFEAYCKERWKFTSRRAQQLMESAKVADDPKMRTVVRNESQARELARIEPEDRPAVVKEALKAAPKDDEGKPKITAAVIREAAEKLTAPKAPPPRTSPGESALDPAVKRVFADIIAGLRASQDQIEAASKSHYGRAIALQRSNRDIENVIEALRFAVPAKLCPCEGANKTCVCKGGGWLTKQEFDNWGKKRGA